MARKVKHCILVWSSEFHRAAFKLAVTKLNQPILCHLYRYGSQISVALRLSLFAFILYRVLVQHAAIYAPDSDCGITRILVRLLSWLGRGSDVYLIPDGYITTKPLTLFPDNFILSRPVTVNEVMVYLAATHGRKGQDDTAGDAIHLVSIKKPGQMPILAAIQLAKAMLRDAAEQRLTSSSDGQVKQIHVICHRTFPLKVLRTILRNLEPDYQRTDESSIRFELCEFPLIPLERVAHHYSLPSTVIWEVWQANEAAVLHLYDPTLAQHLQDDDAWVGELSSALARTRTMAVAQQRQLQQSMNHTDPYKVELWSS
ncbi:MAG: hypothetical protein ACKOYK_06825 [Cyanobium sp.]